MKFIVENIKTTAVIGGRDNLLEIDLAKELREYLRVRPDGYSQSKAYGSHRWDGYRYFVSSKNEFLTGFLPLVLKHFHSGEVS